MRADLYFVSILLTGFMTGFLAWHAWRRRSMEVARAYLSLAFGECLLTLAESLSMLSPTATAALFWFRVRYGFIAVIPVLWLLFALEYAGQMRFPKRRIIWLLVVPVVTQILQWSNGLHGLWVSQEVSMQHSGAFWIAQTGARLPGPGFLFHSFYCIILLMGGSALLFITAWRQRGLYRNQSLLLAGAAAVALTTGLIPTFNLIPHLQINLFTPGVGLSTLLVAMAVYHFKFLKSTPVERSSMATQTQRSLATFMFIFSLMATGVATISYQSYRSYERQFHRQVENQLAGIAALKVEELQDWRRERLGDAEILHNNPVFSTMVQRVLENPDEATERAALQAWLKQYLIYGQYDRIFLLDTDGVVRLSATDSDEPVAAHLVENLAGVMAAGQITFLDFHRDAPDGPVYLALLIPIFAEPGQRPLGLLVMRIDPAFYLYPYLQQWPIPSASASAETALLRREGDTVLYLNELKFQPDAALNLRVSLAETERPSVQAALGHEGIVEGVNYRGVPVIAAVHAVPDSPWFLAARVDTAEVYAPLHGRMWETVIFFGLLLAASGAGLGLIWRQQRVRYYRGQTEAAQALHESEDKFKYLFEHSIIGKSITLPSGEIDVNQAFCDMLGYTPEELQNRRWQEITHPDDIAPTQSAIDPLLSGEQDAVRFTKRYLHKNGAVVWADVGTSLRRDEAGRPLYFITAVNDITERKQAEATLHASEERYHAVVELQTELIDRWRPDGTLTFVNDAYCRYYGQPREALIGRKWMDVVAEEDRERVKEHTGHLVTCLSPANPMMTEEHQEIGMDGSICWQQWTDQALFDEQGHLVEFQSVGRDITERKRAENTLRESEERYRQIIHVADGVAYEHDWRADSYPFIESGIEQLVGYTPEEFTPAVFRASITETENDTGGPDQDATRTVNFRRSDLRLRRKDGSTVWAMDCAVRIRNDQGDVVRTIGMFQDITTRKEAEENLRLALEEAGQSRRVLLSVIEDQKRMEETLAAERALLRTLVDHLPDGVYVKDTGCRKTLANPANVRKSGFTAEAEVLGKTDFELFPRHLAEKYYADDQHVLQSGQPILNREEESIQPNGSQGWQLTSKVPLRDSSGQIIGLVGIGHDITEHKRAEEALAAERALLRTLVDHLPDAIYVKDAAGRKTLANPADVRNIGGAAEADALGKTDFDLFPPDLAEIYYADDQQVIQSGQPILNREEGITRPDGSRGWQLTSKVPVYDSAGQVVGLVGIGHDITARKRAEEALRESEERYRQVIRVAYGIAYEYNWINKTYPFMEESIESLLGYSPAEMTPALFQKLILETRDYTSEDAPEFDAPEFMGSAGPAPYHRADLRLRKKDGSTVWVMDCAVRIRNDKGEVIRTLGMLQDITNRKRAEEALRESEERFRSLYENSTIGLYRTTPNGRILLANPALVKMLGYASFEALAARNLAHEGYGPSYSRGQFLEVVERDGEIRDLESSWTRQDGAALFVRESARAICDPQGTTLYYDGTIEDITERKRAQAEIVRNAEQLATTIDVQHTLAATLDPRTIWTALGQGVQRLFPDVSTIFISSYDSERALISAVYGWQDGEPVDLGALPPIPLSPPGRGTQSRVIHTRQPLVIATDLKEKVSQGNVVVRVGESAEDTQSALYVPMLIQNDVRGVIQLQSYAPDRFREADVRLLALVANTAAVSLQNARLYELAQDEIAERERAEQIIARRALELQMLYESSQQLKRTLDLEEIYHTIHHFIAQTMPCSGLFISAFDADTALITCRAAWIDGAWLNVADFPPIPLEPEGQGTQSVAIRTGQPLLLNDYEQHVASNRTRYHVDKEGALYEEVPDDAPRTRAALIIPLEVEGRVAGVIQVFSDDLNAFNQDHLRLLESLSMHIASSVQNAVLYQAAQREIAERKRTEEALAASERQFRELFQAIPACSFTFDRQGGILNWNRACETLYGWTAPEAIGQSMFDLMVQEKNAPPTRQNVAAVFEGSTFEGLEFEDRRADGSSCTVLANEYPFIAGDGQVLFGVCAELDITKRKEAERRLQESETMLRLIFEYAFDGISIHQELPGQRTRRLIDCNERYADMAGRSKQELLEIGNTSSLQRNIGPQRDTEENVRLRLERESYQGIFSWARPDKKENVIEYTAAPIQMGDLALTVGIDRDVTERRRAAELLRLYTEQLEALVAERTRALEEAQERLLRQERLTVLGQIAGGIAHELRTPLGAIKNSIYLLNILVDAPDPTVTETMAIMNQEIATSDRIITSLLNFTRPQRPARQIVDMNQMIEQALSSVEVPPQVAIQRSASAELPPLLADAGQLEQVFGNLMLNAIQAMPQGGQLTIQTGQVQTLPENVETGFMPTGEGRDDGWIVISVSDSGTGISPEHLANLFQPLFTTKSTGMGLGLALVKLLTEANGGGIAVESTLGQGTTFHTYWPIPTRSE